MGVDPEEQVAILQAQIRDRLAELRSISQGIRVGSGAGQGSADEADPGARQIDLTDGIDLTDARLTSSGWDEDGDTAEIDTPDEDEDAFSRHRQQRHRADPGPDEPSDSAEGGPRLLGDGAGQDGPQTLGENRAGGGRISFQDATDAVIAATRELISFERRLPLLLDAGPRRQSLLIVRWSGVLVAAVALSLLVAAVAGWLPRWWLLPAIGCAGAAALLLRLPVHPPGDRHETLRPGSVVVAAGALLIALCATAGMPALILLLGIVAMVAGIWHAQQHPVRVGALPRRFR